MDGPEHQPEVDNQSTHPELLAPEHDPAVARRESALFRLTVKNTLQLYSTRIADGKTSQNSETLQLLDSNTSDGRRPCGDDIRISDDEGFEQLEQRCARDVGAAYDTLVGCHRP